MVRSLCSVRPLSGVSDPPPPSRADTTEMRGDSCGGGPSEASLALSGPKGLGRVEGGRPEGLATLPGPLF